MAGFIDRNHGYKIILKDLLFGAFMIVAVSIYWSYSPEKNGYMKLLDHLVVET